MKELKLLIYAVQNGDHNKFYEVVEKLRPLIQKYVRLLYKDEKEDVSSELVLALWEAVISIQYAEVQGQIMSYLCKALHNKFLELYRKSRNQHDYEICLDNMNVLDIQVVENQYNDVITEQDMINMLEIFNGVKKDIYYSMTLEMLTDIQLALKFGISRQYANRLRKQLWGILKIEYFKY